MANKKISQLNAVDPAIGIGSVALFPIVSGTGPGDFQTAKITALEIANFVLNPMPVGPNASDIPSIGFTGDADINFKKTNWINASNANVENYPYLQVRKSDGLLVTGSGVAFDSATVPWDFIATEDIDMQTFDITGKAIEIKGVTKISFYDAALDPPWDSANTYIYVDTNVPEDMHISADSDLDLKGQTTLTAEGGGCSFKLSQVGGLNLMQITGSNLQVDPANKLTTNQIIVEGVTSEAYGTDDWGVIEVISGSIEMTNGAIISASTSGTTSIDWARSNISHKSIDDNTTLKFYNVRDGQTYTMFVKNTDTANPSSGTFLYSMGTSVSDATTGVHWGEQYDGPQQGYIRAAPTIAKGRTNIYTFVCIETGVFASAVTGYAY